MMFLLNCSDEQSILSYAMYNEAPWLSGCKKNEDLFHDWSFVEVGGGVRMQYFCCEEMLVEFWLPST